MSTTSKTTCYNCGTVLFGVTHDDTGAIASIDVVKRFAMHIDADDNGIAECPICHSRTSLLDFKAVVEHMLRTQGH